MRLVRAVAPFAVTLVVAAGVAWYVTYEPEVVSLDVSPARVALAPKGELALAVSLRTALPATLNQPAVRWSVDPPNLASVSPDGIVRAGPVSGSGTVTAVAGRASATVALVVECPRSTEAAGLAFSVTCTGTADVYLETGLPPSAGQTVLRSVDGDVAQLERDFARAFARRPRVHVFASKQSFAIGLRDVLAEGGKLPRTLIEADGVFVTGRDVIGIDWEEASKLTPFTTLRHELAHKMVSEIVGANAKALPAWLDEGNARLAETTLPGTEWLATRERYFAVSMAATDTLFRLEELADLDAWGARTGAAADYQYHQASQAAALLRDDVGPAGVLRILEQIGAGKDFASAYAGVAGRDAASFAAELPQRLRAVASSPGIATAPDTPKGPGLSLILYGWTPRGEVTVTLTGGRQQGRSVDTVSAYGSAFVVVGKELPPGTYTVTAVGPNGRVTISARKVN